MCPAELAAVAATVLAMVLVAWELYVRTQPAHRAAMKLPGTKIYPIIGSMLDGRDLGDPVRSFQHALRMAKIFKQGYRYFVFNQLHYWPIRCHEVEFLFNSAKHADKSFIYKFMIPIMGEGLLISNGAKWAHRRKILTPAFHFNILQKFLHTFKEESTSFVDKLAADGDNPDGTEISDPISRLTLNNVCETAMGVKLNSTIEPDNYRGMIYRSGELLLKRYINPFLQNEMVFACTRTSYELNKCVRRLHNFSGSLIEKRRTAYRTRVQLEDRGSDNIYEKSRYAMLDTLLEAETEGQIDAAGIQEEVDTFMFEGYDTTSCGLNFCFFTIGTYQDAQAKMYEEITDVLAEHGGDCDQLGIHDYSRLTYMDQVIKETFRLFPPVPYISRQLTEPVDLLGNVTLPAETIVHINLYNLHRDPLQFPDPEQFEPDRFLPENTERRHPFAYVPFSAGTRNCIGQKFAMLEIKCLLSRLLLEYRLETVTKLAEIQIISDIVLRTLKPIRVKFIKRNK